MDLVWPFPKSRACRRPAAEMVKKPKPTSAVQGALAHAYTNASAAREFQRNMNRSLHRTKSWSGNSSSKDEDDDYTHAHDQNTPQYFQLPQTSSMMDLRLTDIRKQVTYLIQFQHSEIQSIPQFDLGCVTRNFG